MVKAPGGPSGCGASSGNTPVPSKMLKFVKVGMKMPDKRDATARRDDFDEIYEEYKPDKAAEQASRCSQCGVPFCQVHCPLHNNIPDWLKLTAEGRLEEAYEIVVGDQHLPRDLRPHLPAGPAVRRQLRHRASRPRHRHHRRGREIHHRHRLGKGLGQAAEAACASATQSVGIIGAGPAGLAAAERAAHARAIRSLSMTATTASAGC